MVFRKAAQGLQQDMFCLQVLSKTGFDPELYLTLEGLAPWGWEETWAGDQALVTIHCQQVEDVQRIQRELKEKDPLLSITCSQQASQDWSTAWQDFFLPVNIQGQFVILPSWEQVPASDSQEMFISIEPGMAFGTGQHPSTQLCLRALAKLRDTGLIQAGSSFLDLGTGSGILGIAAAKMGLRGLGLDCDPVAGKNSQLNKRLNPHTESLLLCTGDLCCLKQGVVFDLILANILSNPLIEMAQRLVPRLGKAGVLVLSGILQEQEEKVLAAYQGQSTQVVEVLHQKEWSGLIVRSNRG